MKSPLIFIGVLFSFSLLSPPHVEAKNEPKVTSSKTIDLQGGGIETTTNYSDGSQRIIEKGRIKNPMERKRTFDKEGNIISEQTKDLDGRTETMSYEPKTGLRRRETLDAKGGKTVSVTQKSGDSIITQTGFNKNTRTIEEDAAGNVKETTTRPDGTKSIETFKRGNFNPYKTTGDAITTTTTEYGKDEKANKQVKSTTERWGKGYRQTSREVTEYGQNGKPIKTIVTAPKGRFGEWITVEVVEYWANGFRKRIRRKDAKGDDAGIYDYDHLGALKRSSIRPGHKAGNPPTSGTWFIPKSKNKKISDAQKNKVTDAFASTDFTDENPANFGESLGRELAVANDGAQSLPTSHEDHARS